MRKLFCAFLLFLCMSSLSSCSDDDNTSYGSLDLEFDNVVGLSDLELNTADEPYTNAAGETYKVTKLKYYISNIRLKKNDGSIYTDKITADGSTGYYLIDESDASTHVVTLENVPAGDYTEITFTIGVDANQVSEGAQTGALDPANGMFWSWNSGYIFVMMEGISSQSSDPDHYIVYHVGGYKSDASSPSLVNNVKTKTVLTGVEPAMVRSDLTPEVHMIIDVNKFFASPNEISFAATPVQHSPAENTVVAENYLNTFVVDHVHN